MLSNANRFLCHIQISLTGRAHSISRDFRMRRITTTDASPPTCSPIKRAVTRRARPPLRRNLSSPGEYSLLCACSVMRGTLLIFILLKVVSLRCVPVPPAAPGIRFEAAQLYVQARCDAPCLSTFTQDQISALTAVSAGANGGTGCTTTRSRRRATRSCAYQRVGQHAAFCCPVRLTRPLAPLREKDVHERSGQCRIETGPCTHHVEGCAPCTQREGAAKTMYRPGHGGASGESKLYVDKYCVAY